MPNLTLTIIDKTGAREIVEIKLKDIPLFQLF